MTRLVLRLSAVLTVALLGGCDLLSVDPPDPVALYRGDWQIDEVRTQEFTSTGEIISDDTARDLGVLEIGVKTVSFDVINEEITRDVATAPPEFLALFRPFVLLAEASALTRYDDGSVGSAVSAIELRLVFSGNGRSNRSGSLLTDFSHVATATLDGDRLTLLYVESAHPLGTFRMSRRQEVRLRRVGGATG